MNDLTFAEISRRFLDAFAYLEQSVSVVERHERDGITWLHWPKSGRRGGRFHYEFFGTDCDPATMVRVVEDVNPGQPFFISDIYGSRGSSVEAFRQAGYESNFQEPMMLLDLATVPIPPPSDHICDVETLDLADRIYQAFERAGDYPRQTSQVQIDDSQTLIKAVLIDGQPAATGKGVLLGETLYVTDIGTVTAFRKRGFGAAIMNVLHTSAREQGATVAILSASQMAASLYRSLGYQDVGTLDIYEPVNQR